MKNDYFYLTNIFRGVFIVFQNFFLQLDVMRLLVFSIFKMNLFCFQENFMYGFFAIFFVFLITVISNWKQFFESLKYY